MASTARLERSDNTNPFDPFEDTERLDAGFYDACVCHGFNPFDPFEDTERRITPAERERLW